MCDVWLGPCQNQKKYLPRQGNHETLIHNPLNELIEPILYVNLWPLFSEDFFVHLWVFVSGGFAFSPMSRWCQSRGRAAEAPEVKAIFYVTICETRHFNFELWIETISGILNYELLFSLCKYFARGFFHPQFGDCLKSELQQTRWQAWWKWKREAGRPKTGRFAHKVSQGFLFGIQTIFCHTCSWKVHWSPKNWSSTQQVKTSMLMSLPLWKTLKSKPLSEAALHIHLRVNPLVLAYLGFLSWCNCGASQLHKWSLS